MNQFISKNEYESVRERNCLFILSERPDDAVSLNRTLAEKLSKVSPSMRTLHLPRIISQVIDEQSDNPVICDIDVLFNPDYRIDVLKILIEIDKQKNFTLVWPGVIVDGKLIYGEEGYADYKVYNISNYNIICVI